MSGVEHPAVPVGSIAGFSGRTLAGETRVELRQAFRLTLHVIEDQVVALTEDPRHGLIGPRVEGEAEGSDAQPAWRIAVA